MDYAPTLHQSSWFALLTSLLEPNLLILVAYFAFNVHLARKVLAIATRSQSTATVIPPIAEDAEATGAASSDERERSEVAPSNIKATQLLVGLSTWAFSNEAQNAKRVTAFMALASLGSTWYYMLSYLNHSYHLYIGRCLLTSYPLPPVPPPLNWSRPDLFLPSIHLTILRISQWLGSLSLFEEAWMQVVSDRNAWWWSSEICIFTVGSWAVFLRSESKRLKIPFVWTFMALGQLVAISFAFNLFQLAVLYRIDAADLVPPASSSGIQPALITPAEGQQRRPGQLPRSESGLLMPPPLGTPDRGRTARLASSASPSTQTEATAAATITASTTVVQRLPLAPKPSLLDRVGLSMARFVPEGIAIPVFLAGGLESVLTGPDTLAKVLVMHAFPFLLVIYPIRRVAAKKLKTSAAFGHPIASASGVRTATARFVRRKKVVPIYLDEKWIHVALALCSLYVRSRASYDVVANCRGAYDLPVPIWQRVWQAVTLVYPQTFHRHPAVSSIGSDHLVVVGSVMASILLESGLWIWKDAKTSPSAHVIAETAASSAGPAHKAEGQAHPDLLASTKHITVALDSIDRSRLEFQSRLVLIAVALAPVWGASTTLGMYLALREIWVEDEEQAHQQRIRLARSRYFGKHAASDASSVADPAMGVAEEVVGRILENEEGERMLEIRQTKVSVSRAAGPADDVLVEVGVEAESRARAQLGHESETSSAGGGSVDDEALSQAKRTRTSSSSGTAMASSSPRRRTTQRSARRSAGSGQE